MRNFRRNHEEQNENVSNSGHTDGASDEAGYYSQSRIRAWGTRVPINGEVASNYVNDEFVNNSDESDVNPVLVDIIDNANDSDVNNNSDENDAQNDPLAIEIVDTIDYVNDDDNNDSDVNNNSDENDTHNDGDDESDPFYRGFSGIPDPSSIFSTLNQRVPIPDAPLEFVNNLENGVINESASIRDNNFDFNDDTRYQVSSYSSMNTTLIPFGPLPDHHPYPVEHVNNREHWNNVLFNENEDNQCEILSLILSETNICDVIIGNNDNLRDNYQSSGAQNNLYNTVYGKDEGQNDLIQHNSAPTVVHYTNADTINHHENFENMFCDLTWAVGNGGAGLPPDFGRDRGHFQTFQRPCLTESVESNRVVATAGVQEGNCPPGFCKDRQSITSCPHGITNLPTDLNNDADYEIGIESNIENNETVTVVDVYEEIRIIHRRGLRALFAPTPPHFTPAPPHFAPATLTISNILDKAKKTDNNNENDKNDQNDKNDKHDKNDKNHKNDKNEKNDEADKDDKDDENDNPDGYLPLKIQFRPIQD